MEIKFNKKKPIDKNENHLYKNYFKDLKLRKQSPKWLQ